MAIYVPMRIVPYEHVPMRIVPYEHVEKLVTMEEDSSIVVNLM